MEDKIKELEKRIEILEKQPRKIEHYYYFNHPDTEYLFNHHEKSLEKESRL